LIIFVTCDWEKLKDTMFTDYKLQEAFEKSAKIRSVKAGEVITNSGQYVQFVPIVISGCIRVLREDENANEVFLYHLMPNETCALSLSCCSTNKESEVKTIAEDDTQMWTIPIEKVEEWQKFTEWREFVAMTYQSRFETLLNVIDDIAFKKLDKRLWNYLKARSKAQGSKQLNISHEEIAQELNIQRESATRLIKKLKEMQFVETARNQITLLK